jgi:hypothetical protein
VTDRRKTIGCDSRKSVGQSLAEFGLILGLVVLVSVAGVQLLGGNITQQLQAYVTPMSAANPNPGTAASPYASVSYDTTPASASATPGGTESTPSDPTPALPTSPQTDLPAGILPSGTNPNLALVGTPGKLADTAQTPASQPEKDPAMAKETTDSNNSSSPTNDSKTTTPTSTTTADNNQPNTDQSAWGNASPGCVGCTQNMTGNWGW